MNLFYPRPHRVWGLGEQPPTSQFPFLTCVLQLQVRCQMMEIVPTLRQGLRQREVDSSLFTWVSKTSVKPILGCVSQCVVKFVVSLTRCILQRCWLESCDLDLSRTRVTIFVTCDLTWTCKEMTCDLTWTCKEMTCDLTWTCKEMTCDLTWTCKEMTCYQCKSKATRATQGPHKFLK